MHNKDEFTQPARDYAPSTELPTDASTGMTEHFGGELEPISETAIEPAGEPVHPEKTGKPKVKGSLAGGTWVALIFGCLLLILLLVFILQNQQTTELNFFTWNFTFPAGVGFLLSSIAGALIMALVGGVRMLELRRQVKKQQRKK